MTRYRIVERTGMRLRGEVQSYVAVLQRRVWWGWSHVGCILLPDEARLITHYIEQWGGDRRVAWEFDAKAKGGRGAPDPKPERLG